MLGNMVRYLVLFGVLCGALADDSGIDPDKEYAWGENVGWVSGAPTNAGITVHFNGQVGWLSGNAWGENVGWIVMGSASNGPYVNTTSTNWGLNMDATGKLSGYAWGENIGWVNFGHEQCGAAIDPEYGRFTGYAWGENIGWLHLGGLSTNYGVRTLAFDTQVKGTPNWWLNHHHVGEDYDEGDGVSAWKEYIADTDPNDSSSFLHITSLSSSTGKRLVTFSPVSTQRCYTLRRRAGLKAGGWTAVPGQVSVQYETGGEKTMQDNNAATAAFYTVRAGVTP